VVLITYTILNNDQTIRKADYQIENMPDLPVQKKGPQNSSQIPKDDSTQVEMIKKIVRPPYNFICKNVIKLKYKTILFRRSLSTKKFRRNDALYAFYDLDVMSAAFDIIPFLILAEKIRLFRGLKSLHVIIVPGSKQGFAEGYFEYYRGMTPDKEKIRFAYLEWRVRNILVPCCWLMPSCKHLTVCMSRSEAREIENLLAKHIFPDKYLVDFPINPNKNIYLMEVTPDNATVPGICATQTACDFVHEWIDSNCKGKKVVTITLRESTYEINRNSNILAWMKFVRSLDQDKFFPVIIRDTEKEFQSIPKEMAGVTIFSEASWNIEIRAALYQICYLNLFSSGGPMTLAWFNKKCRCLSFKLISDSPVATEDHLKFLGYKVGDQLSYFSKFQKIVWHDDTYDVIKKEFEEMCLKIDSESDTA
jgi:hypothetical protein